MRSPADVFFYSGHGAWWNGALLRDQGANAPHHYDDWLVAETLLKSWHKTDDWNRSPWDLDVLIINLKAANALGLTISREMQSSADEVIE